MSTSTSRPSSHLTDTIVLPPPTNPPTWAQIKHVICAGNLDDLYRDAACEEAYRAWSGPVKREWGSLERFIRVVRLGWDDPLAGAATAAAATTAGQGGDRVKEVILAATSREALENAFFEDLEDEWLVKMIPNHWPYNMPHGCTHWCVWSRKPITHISQLPEPDQGDQHGQDDGAPGGSSSSGSGTAQSNGHATTSSSSATSPSPTTTINPTSKTNQRKLATAGPHATPVPWPFPHMSRVEQEELYAAVSHDGIRAVVHDLPASPSSSSSSEEEVVGKGHDLVTGEYVLDFFRSRPHLARSVVLPPGSGPSSASLPANGDGADDEAAARLAAHATMSYFSQHCVSFTRRVFPSPNSNGSGGSGSGGSKGFKTVLFCNPPHLRTVPGLDHWHIMAMPVDGPASPPSSGDDGRTA